MEDRHNVGKYDIRVLEDARVDQRLHGQADLVEAEPDECDGAEEQRQEDLVGTPRPEDAAGGDTEEEDGRACCEEGGTDPVAATPGVRTRIAPTRIDRERVQQRNKTLVFVPE